MEKINIGGTTYAFDKKNAIITGKAYSGKTHFATHLVRTLIKSAKKDIPRIIVFTPFMQDAWHNLAAVLDSSQIETINVKEICGNWDNFSENKVYIVDRTEFDGSDFEDFQMCVSALLADDNFIKESIQDTILILEGAERLLGEGRETVFKHKGLSIIAITQNVQKLPGSFILSCSQFLNFSA